MCFSFNPASNSLLPWFRVSGFGFRVLKFEIWKFEDLRFEDFALRMCFSFNSASNSLLPWFLALGSEFWVPGSGFRVSGFEIWDLKIWKFEDFALRMCFSFNSASNSLLPWFLALGSEFRVPGFGFGFISLWSMTVGSGFGSTVQRFNASTVFRFGFWVLRDRRL